MGKEIFDRVFRRDFHKILGFDIFEVTDVIEDLTEREFFNDLFIKPFTVPLQKLKVNLIEVVITYLEYDEKRFPNPMDQYIYIYENQEQIMSILHRDLAVSDPFVCPFSYSICSLLKYRFSRLFRHILTVGKTHKFDEEYILEHLLTDSDGQETD